VGWEANFGGSLDGVDFLTWQRNFGAGSATAVAAAVPELASYRLALAALTLATFVAAKRSRS
jgi:hypothetical protein